MGLFFNTKADKNRKEIENAIQEANKSLNEINAIIENHEYLNYGQVLEIYGYLANVKECRDRAESLIAQLNSMQIEQLCVPWLNGSITPIHLYERMYKHFMSELDNKLQKSM